MEAKYYRFIYRSLGGCVCCSGSMAESREGGEEMFHFLYLGGGGDDRTMLGEEEESLKEHFHLMLIADFRPQTVRQAVKALKLCEMDRVLFPEMEAEVLERLAQDYEQMGNFTKEEIGLVRNPKKYLTEIGIADAEGIKDRETLRRGNRVFRIFCTGGGSERVLLLYHGSEGTSPQEEECIMNVKPVIPSRNCSPFVDPKNLNCEMRCMLYNDFMQCKRHNQKDGTYFVDGHLILGSEHVTVDLGEVHGALKEEWKKIRFVCLPEGSGWNEQLLMTGTAETAQYFMGTETLNDTVIKDILKKDPYRTVVTLGEKTGLCVSGYYVGR